MLKKILLTSAAALAITTGAAAISAPDANAGVSVHLGFGGYGHWHGPRHWRGYGYWRGHRHWRGYGCFKRRVRVTYWRHGHKHRRWVWRTYC